MKVLRELLYIIGFAIYVVCLAALYRIGITEWLLEIGCSFGVLLFTNSRMINSK